MKLASIGILAILAVTPLAAEESSVAIGKPLPELKVQYEKSTPNLSGHAAIVEFWATWCGPCRKSIPHLNKLYGKYKDEGLVVIGITSEEPSAVQKFTEQTPIDYTVAYAADKEVSRQFGVRGIPHAFLVDKSGKIIWRGHPAKLTDEMIVQAMQ